MVFIQDNEMVNITEIEFNPDEVPNFTIPPHCICCMDDSTDKEHYKVLISQSLSIFTLLGHLAVHNNYIDFPICSECQKHLKDYNIKNSFVLISTGVISFLIAVVYYMLIYIFSESSNTSYFQDNHWSLCLLTLFIPMIIIVLNNLFVKYQKLHNDHSHRYKPIESSLKFTSARKFIFWNNKYAELFEKSNLIVKKMIKTRKYNINQNKLYSNYDSNYFQIVLLAFFLGVSGLSLGLFMSEVLIKALL